MKWKVEKKEKGEVGDNGYTCVVEKKRIRKRKKRKRMAGLKLERNEGKIQFRNATTIFSQ